MMLALRISRVDLVQKRGGMGPKLDTGVVLQRKYYTDTATRYDQMHEHEGSEDALGNKFVHAILRMIDARSVLDVGTATGRSLRDLKEALPQAFVCGIEPVAALLKEAVANDSTTSGSLVRGSGEALPFADASFDAVCEFAVLHHVANPNAVVKEMLRVAKKAVLIADSNRFGQGSRAARFLKLALYKTKLWSTFNYVRTAGKGYQITEGVGSQCGGKSLQLVSSSSQQRRRPSLRTERILLATRSGGPLLQWRFSSSLEQLYACPPR